MGTLQALIQRLQLLAILAGISAADVVGAQAIVPERPGDDRQRFRELPLEKPRPAPEFTLPPVTPPDPSDQPLSVQLRIEVKDIKLEGNRVFSDLDLVEVTRRYEGREISSEDLQALRRELTFYYVDRGYINSGAVIPDQEVKDGIITIRIVEGRLTAIDVTGNAWLRKSYVKDRVQLDSQGALKLQRLRKQLQLLQQDRLIDRVNAELSPGLALGEAVLKVRIAERRPYELGFGFNNHRSPSVGALRGEVYASMFNVSGFGDALSFRYGITEGLDEVTTSYAVPLTARGTLLRLFYDQNSSQVIEAPFDLIDITSETQSGGLSISHPFYHTPQTQVVGELRLERRHSETFLLGERFSFSAGPKDGMSDVSVVRASQEWVHRTPDQILAARSTFSVGVDLLGATINAGAVPDGRFFAWLGQFQWVRRLWDTDNQLILRSDLQVSADPLLPLEKLAVGGAATVRGYRENVFVRDNGWVSSLEFRIPIFRLPLPWLSQDAQDGWMQLAPFFDAGWSTNTDEDTPSPETIYSAGLGLRWDPSPRVHSEFYWGHPFKEVEDPIAEHDLQDDGIHFALNVKIF